jgi:hypothetical protein
MRGTGTDLEVEIYATKPANETSLWTPMDGIKGPNRVGVSPHLRTETDPVSETSCFSF